MAKPFAKTADRAARPSAAPAVSAAPVAAFKLEEKVATKVATKPVDVSTDSKKAKKEKPNSKSKFAVQSYRIEVGTKHDVTPGSIVGVIAAEASLEAKHIGRIDIFDTYSLLDLPEGMPQHILDNLKNVRLAGQTLRISHVGAGLINSEKPVGKKKAK